ncbi:MAG: hypothetical protein Q8L48_09700 [Archangium sp.]|nr:hypothetical protein [Archangium sp.]
MRAWLTMMLVLVSCRPADSSPELRLLWAQDGISTSSDSGEVPLDPVTSGCSRESRLQLQNVGAAAATLSVSTSSPLVTVLDAPATLAPGEAGELTLLVSARFEQSNFVESGLTIEAEGRAFQFHLKALVFLGEWDLPGPFDFGAVEVGARRSLPGTSLAELSGAFSQSNGALWFAPRAVGRHVLSVHPGFALNCPDLRVALIGEGVAAVLTGPTSVNFGDVVVGNAVEFDVPVQNLSFDEVQVAVSGPGFTLASPVTSPSVATRNDVGALVPGTLTQRVRFSPGTPGPAAGQLELTAGSGRLLIPVHGAGTL